MMPLSSVSETPSTLPGTCEPVDPDDRFTRTGRRRARARPSSSRPPSRRACCVDQGAPVDLVDLVRRDALAVAQHRHAVAELEDLVEPVRDEDDAPPLRDEVARRAEDALDLGLAERRRRLVEDEQARVADEQSRDLDELALADRERLDGGAELHVAEAELVEDAARVLRQTAPPVDERNVEATEEDVVLDAELGDEAQLLVHERDPVRLRVVRVPERDLLAVEADDAFVGLGRARRAPSRACSCRRRCARRSRAPRRPVHRARGPRTARTGPKDFERSTTSSTMRAFGASTRGERDPDVGAGSRSPFNRSEV